MRFWGRGRWWRIGLLLNETNEPDVWWHLVGQNQEGKLTLVCLEETDHFGD